MIENNTRLYLARMAYYSNEYGLVVEYAFSTCEYLSVKYAQIATKKFNAHNQHYREQYKLTCEIMETTRRELTYKGMYDPTAELGVYNDINGNQYLLTKRLYCIICNSYVKDSTLNGLPSDINKLVPSLLLMTSRFTENKDFINILAKIASRTWETDPFTKEAQVRPFQYFRIHPVARRSYDIRCQND